MNQYYPDKENNLSSVNNGQFSKNIFFVTGGIVHAQKVGHMDISGRIKVIPYSSTLLHLQTQNSKYQSVE